MSVSGSVRSAARMTAATSSRGCDASRRGKRRLKSRDHPIAHYKCYGVAMTQLDPEKPRDYWIYKSPLVPKGLRPHVASSECPCNPKIDLSTKDNEVFWTLTHNEMRLPR